MANDLPWDDQTDRFIANIDSAMLKKYGTSLRTLLLNPDKYWSKKGMGEILKSMTKDVDDYFDTMLSGLVEEQASLQKDLENVTAYYKQIHSVVMNKASVARIPYFKPLFIDRKKEEEETIIVGQYDEELDALIGKLIYASNYVADMSAAYRDYMLGSWLFSGQKNYVVTLNPPASPVLIISNSKDLIDSMLNNIGAGLG